VPEPPCLGLTGGIGSGKSAALDAFARRGAAVLSSDAVVHRLYEDPVVVDAVRGRFGDVVLDPSGGVDRAVLGPRAFAEDGGIAFLESLLHPRIGPVREAWMREQRGRSPRPPLLVCEVPLLFEAGLAPHFDAVLVVTASNPVRRMRVEERGQHFDERRAHQMDEDAKVAAADEAYVNDGSLDDLQAWVDDVMARYGAGVADGAP
jgi:dephospho-CoA kinase